MKLKELYENEDKDELYKKWASGAITYDKKELLIPLLLHELKAGNVWLVRDKIKSAREYGYDYPEFKDIEKSIGKITEAKGSFSIYSDEGKFTFSDKEKFIKHLLRFMKSGERGDEDEGWIRSKVLWWIKMARDDGYDYPEFKTIEKSLGKIQEGLFTDGFYTMENHPGGSSREIYIRYSDHRELIKYLLQRLKGGDNGSHDEVRYRIRMCRDAGYEYPEFEAIEKSLGPIEEGRETAHTRESVGGGGSEDGIPVYTCPDPTKPDVKHVVKFKDHEAFIKLCLQELKTGSISEVKHWIRMCRGCGYDYPEFKTIEKSIGKVPGKFTESLQGMPQWIYGEKITLKFSDKDKFLRELLKDLKSGELDNEDIKYWINQSRKAGYDYPEFETIEKSIEKVPGKQTESIEDDGIKFITADGYELVKFSDKDAIMKRILKFMKNDNCEYEVQYCINACRKAGYDYPEFKVIEKSIGKEE